MSFFWKWVVLKQQLIVPTWDAASFPKVDHFHGQWSFINDVLNIHIKLEKKSYDFTPMARPGVRYWLFLEYAGLVDQLKCSI